MPVSQYSGSWDRNHPQLHSKFKVSLLVDSVLKSKQTDQAGLCRQSLLPPDLRIRIQFLGFTGWKENQFLKLSSDLHVYPVCLHTCTHVKEKGVGRERKGRKVIF